MSYVEFGMQNEHTGGQAAHEPALSPFFAEASCQFADWTVHKYSIGTPDLWSWKTQEQVQTLMMLRDYVSWTNEAQNFHTLRTEERFSPRTSECFDNSQTCERVEAVGSTSCTRLPPLQAPPVGVGKILALLGFGENDQMRALPYTWDGKPMATLDLISLKVKITSRKAKFYPTWYTQPPTKRAIVTLKESSGSQRSRGARAFCILEFVEKEEVINILFLSGTNGGAEALLAYLTSPDVGPLSGTPRFTSLVAQSNTNMLYAQPGQGRSVCVAGRAAAFSENEMYRDKGFKNATSCPANAHKQYSQEDSRMVFCAAHGLLGQRRPSSESVPSREDSLRAKQQRSPAAPTVPMDEDEPEAGEELTSPPTATAATAASAVPVPVAAVVNFWNTHQQTYEAEGRTYLVLKYNVQNCHGISTLTSGPIIWPVAPREILLGWLRKYTQQTISDYKTRTANHVRRFWPRQEECFDDSDVCQRLEDIKVNENAGKYCMDTNFSTTDWVPISVGFLLSAAGFKENDKVQDLVKFDGVGVKPSELNIKGRTGMAKHFPGYSEAKADAKLAFISLAETGGRFVAEKAEAFCFFQLEKHSIEIHALWGRHGGGAALLKLLTDHTVGPLASTETKHVSLHSVDTIYAPHNVSQTEVCDPEVTNPNVFSLNKYYRSKGFVNAFDCPANEFVGYEHEVSGNTADGTKMVYCNPLNTTDNHSPEEWGMPHFQNPIGAVWQLDSGRYSEEYMLQHPPSRLVTPQCQCECGCRTLRHSGEDWGIVGPLSWNQVSPDAWAGYWRKPRPDDTWGHADSLTNTYQVVCNRCIRSFQQAPYACTLGPLVLP